MKMILILTLVTFAGCSWVEEMTTKQAKLPRCQSHLCLGPTDFARGVEKRHLEHLACRLDEQYLLCESAVGITFDCQCAYR